MIDTGFGKGQNREFKTANCTRKVHSGPDLRQARVKPVSLGAEREGPCWVLALLLDWARESRMLSCLIPPPGYSHHSGAILPPVPRWVLHSKGDGSAEKAQRGSEEVVLGLVKGSSVLRAFG